MEDVISTGTGIVVTVWLIVSCWKQRCPKCKNWFALEVQKIYGFVETFFGGEERGVIGYERRCSACEMTQRRALHPDEGCEYQKNWYDNTIGWKPKEQPLRE